MSRSDDCSYHSWLVAKYGMVGWWCLGERVRETRMVVGACVRYAGNFWRGRVGESSGQTRIATLPRYHATGTQDAEKG